MKLYDSIECLYGLRAEAESYRRSVWNAFCQVNGVSQSDIDVILCFVQNEHAVRCKILSEMYPTTKEWFEKGAFEQAALDEEFHAMITLLSSFSFI